jgi:S1-C subfamily serine protease
MFNPRQFFWVLALGVVGGIIASVFIFPLLVRVNFLNTATLLDKILKSQTITQIQKETIIISPSDYFSEAIKKVEPSVVAVQSFSGGQLIRSGSGIILTQDGLVATTNSIAPASTEIFQIFNGGKIYKGKAVFRDYGKNIVIISVPEADFQVARFKTDLPNLGQELLVFSKLVGLGRESPFVEEAVASRIDESAGIFEISAPYDHRLYGSALIDGEGTVLGMIDFKNQKPVVTFSKLIENTLNAYLARLR